MMQKLKDNILYSDAQVIILLREIIIDNNQLNVTSPILQHRSLLF